MHSVAVLSSTNLDVRFITGDRPSTWNQEVYVDSIEVGIGGKGFKMALAAAWLGADVVLLTPKARDDVSELIQSAVARAAREVDDARRSYLSRGEDGALAPGWLQADFYDTGGPSGVVGAFGSARSRPTYLTRRNRSHWGVAAFSLPATWRDQIAEAEALLISLEPPLKLVAEAAAVAKAHGRKVVLTAAPPPRDENDRAASLNLLRNIDALVLDRREADELVTGEGEDLDDAETLRRLVGRTGRNFELLCMTLEVVRDLVEL